MRTYGNYVIWLARSGAVKVSSFSAKGNILFCQKSKLLLHIEEETQEKPEIETESFFINIGRISFSFV